MDNAITDGRQAYREALRISEETRDWVFIRKADRHVESYELIRGKGNGLPGDRGFLCGRSMCF